MNVQAISSYVAKGMLDRCDAEGIAEKTRALVLRALLSGNFVFFESMRPCAAEDCSFPPGHQHHKVEIFEKGAPIPEQYARVSLSEKRADEPFEARAARIMASEEENAASGWKIPLREIYVP